MSHKGAILVKAQAGGISILWTHFFSSVISDHHNAFLSAKLVWLPVEGGGAGRRDGRWFGDVQPSAVTLTYICNMVNV